MGVAIKEILIDHLTAKRLPLLVKLNITSLMIDNEMEFETTALYYDRVLVVLLNADILL